MEVSTGQVLESADPHRRYPPASLDKLMTFYLTLQAIKDLLERGNGRSGDDHGA